MENLETTTMIWLVLAIIVIGLVVALAKKVIGIAITIAALLLGVYLIFGYTPSETIDEVGKVTEKVTGKFDKQELLASFDGLVKKVSNGNTVWESGEIKVYFDENGEKVIEDLKSKTVIEYEEFKEKLTKEELATVESIIK